MPTRTVATSRAFRDDRKRSCRSLPCPSRVTTDYLACCSHYGTDDVAGSGRVTTGLFDANCSPVVVPVPIRRSEVKRAVELHSEQEPFRGTLTAHTPEKDAATVIVMRRKQHVWLTFNGALTATLVMTNQETARLVDLLHSAQGQPDD